MPLPQTTIRPYKPDDFAAVVSLLADLYPWKRLKYTALDWEQLFEMPLQGQGREAYVLEAEGIVAGIGVLRQRFLFGDYLELFAIAAPVQGKGYGRALLAYLESVAFARAKNLFVCVSDFNEKGRHFYQRNGYTEIGPILHLLIPGSSEILLRKTIGPARQA
jgi:GNAT superfamily N-acetyltransferase